MAGYSFDVAIRAHIAGCTIRRTHGPPHEAGTDLGWVDKASVKAVDWMIFHPSAPVPSVEPTTDDLSAAGALARINEALQPFGWQAVAEQSAWPGEPARIAIRCKP
jgi:hypothetical protein